MTRIGLTISEVASGLGVTRQHVEAQIKSGALESVRAGRRHVILPVHVERAYGRDAAAAMCAAAGVAFDPVATASADAEVA